MERVHRAGNGNFSGLGSRKRTSEGAICVLAPPGPPPWVLPARVNTKYTLSTSAPPQSEPRVL
ncbi:Proliferating cell nuclear antigen [Venturia inaequalis]|nr:Proliferating cell nuclear antigen [Venturia inaequalis]